MLELTNLNVAIVNVYSLVSIAKRVQFDNFLKKYKPHIVLISETHLKNKHKVNFDGYSMFRNDRTNAGRGGTAVCVSNKIKCEHLSAPLNVKSIESCSVKIFSEDSAIIFSSIYRRPISKIIENDLNELINIDRNAQFVIGGDFNAHSPLWGSSTTCSNGRLVTDWFKINKRKFNMTIKQSKEPTCSVSSAGSYVDFAIVSDNFHVTNCDELNKLPSKNIFSNHAVIFMNLNCDKVKLREPTKIKIFKKTDWKRFNAFIDESIIDVKIPINCNMTQRSIDEVCLKIENIFAKAIKTFVPEVAISSTTVELSRKSLNLLNEKKRLMRKKYRNRDNENINSIKSQLKLLNQLLVESISNDYSAWWTSRIKNIKPDNNLFKNIKLISNYKRLNAAPNKLYNSDKSESFSTNNEKCEAWASHFAKSHELTHSNESTVDDEVARVYGYYANDEPLVIFSDDLPADFKQRKGTTVDENVSKKFASVEDIKSIIKSRNNKKSSGIDNMPNFALKKLSLTTVYWITVLFNHITNTQHFPTNWKTASVTPILKPGKNTEFVSSWRPISQLPTLSKCYEKLIDLRIRKFCVQNNIIDSHQFGFQAGCSTLHAIAKIVTDISNGLNKGRPTIAVLIDLQSAFDVIWQNGLIYKLHQMKFEPDLIRIVKNFLRDRKFFVKFNDQKSATKKIVAGTPQGSIISAILFVLYLNDLPKPSNCFCDMVRLLFADDIIIYTVTKNIRLATMTMNNYLNEVYKFFNNWKLKINVNKCESISFVGHYKDLNRTTRRDAMKSNLKINKESVKKVNRVKYLGLVISSNFQFNEHVKYVINKVNAAQAVLSNVFCNKYVSQVVKIISYKQLIRPLMLYASPCWAIKNVISSYQMEQLRKKERWFLRKCLSLFKQENSVKFVNSKVLYDEARVNRIDREIIKANVKFVEKAKLHENEIVSELFTATVPNVDSLKYKPINYYNHLKETNQLHEDKFCLIFNKKKFHPNQSVYVQSQNLTDV